MKRPPQKPSTPGRHSHPTRGRGRPSRKECVWNERQIAFFIKTIAEGRQPPSEIPQLIRTFSEGLRPCFPPASGKQKPPLDTSIERVFRKAIAQEEQQRGPVPAGYIIPIIDYLGLDDGELHILFPKFRGDLVLPRTAKKATQHEESEVRESLPGEEIKHLPQRTFSTQLEKPQWADAEDIVIERHRFCRLKFDLTTSNPYFRIGVKLFERNGKRFGDGSIQSQDTNCVIHIGRNDWDRPRVGVKSNEVFLTNYINGVRVGQDKSLFTSPNLVKATLELFVDQSYCARFFVNDICHHVQVIPSTICHRLAILAWGDHDEFTINADNIRFTTLPEPNAP